MKYLLLCSLLLTGCALAQPPASKFMVRVLDAEIGLPVTHAVVEATFEHDYDPYGNRPDKVDIQKKTVNQNGEVTFSGRTIQRGAGGRVFAEGYYWGGGGTEYKTKNLALNRWEPWNPTIEVKMRPKKNPVSMVRRAQRWTTFPSCGKVIGYDLDVGDWVSPSGKGRKNDFLFEVRKTKSPLKTEYILSFPNPSDGILEYEFPKEQRSSFKWPYVAPQSGYVAQIQKYKVIKKPPYAETNLKDEANYIFRIRTQIDKDGKIISACYGRITGEIELSMDGSLQFSYAFNPDPHSRSLESDKKPY